MKTMKSRVSTYIFRFAVAAAAIVWCGEATAQRHPERRHIREGNRLYEARDYTAAEEKLLEALERNPASFEASFNLADALYKQERYEESVKLLEELVQNPTLTPQQRAEIYHNLGNSMFSMQKLQQAAEFYKQSLRENPADLETKYNLAYVQKLLEEQNNDDNNDQDQNGRNQDNSQNQNDPNSGDDQNKDNPQEGEQNQQQSDPDQQNETDENGEGQQEEQPPQPDFRNEGNGIKREDAESILDAMQQQEDKTREKINEQRAVTVGRSGKNW